MSQKNYLWGCHRIWEIIHINPPLLLERFAKKNTNLVLKFESQVKSHLNGLSDSQKDKLNLILDSDVDELQSIMAEAYQKSNKKQYKILADPKYKQFIEDNLNGIRKIID